MVNVKIYTMNGCPFCERAKALLKQRSVEFDEIKVAEDDDAMWEELYKKSGLKTVPQIWASNRLIGGFSELLEQDGKDQLASLK